MKTIGILGGMSWVSSLEYYRGINERVHSALGGVHAARIVMDSVDFADIESRLQRYAWDEIAELLNARARALQDAGADVIILATNTIHKVLDQIMAGLDIPSIHVGDATAQVIKQRGLKRVALLGTAFTMSQDFYRERIESHGLEVIIPSAADQQLVHEIIFGELVKGVIADESRLAYQGVIDRLVAVGAEGVILGCTEIELLITQADSPVPVFATAQIHAEAAANYALS